MFPDYWADLKNLLNVLKGRSTKFGGSFNYTMQQNQTAKMLDVSVDNQCRPWLALPFAVEEDV
jgi:hypothetical protein